IATADLLGAGVPGFLAGRDFLPGRRSREGPAARGERVARAETEFARRSLPLLPADPYYQPIVLDAVLDGMPDVGIIDDAHGTISIYSATQADGSRPLDLRGAAPPAGFLATDFRVVGAPALDPALAEPGHAARPAAGMRLAPASLARTVSPDRATFA